MIIIDEQYKFEFDAKTFVQSGYELSPGDWADSHYRAITSLRELYPELAKWGDLAIGLAFGDFSQDVLEVSWADWMLESRDDLFLNYCCWRQIRGVWKGGFDSTLLAQANEWKLY